MSLFPHHTPSAIEEVIIEKTKVKIERLSFGGIPLKNDKPLSEPGVKENSNLFVIGDTKDGRTLTESKRGMLSRASHSTLPNVDLTSSSSEENLEKTKIFIGKY